MTCDDSGVNPFMEWADFKTALNLYLNAGLAVPIDWTVKMNMVPVSRITLLGCNSTEVMWWDMMRG